MNYLDQTAGLGSMPTIATHERPDAKGVRVLIVGTGIRAARLSKALARSGRTVVGAVDDDPQPAMAALAPHVPWVGGLARLVQETIDRRIDELHVAMPLRSGFDAWMHTREVAREVGIPAVFELDLTGDLERTRIVTGKGVTPALRYNCHRSRSTFPRLAKRLLDVAGALSVAALTLPLLVLAALAIKLTSPGPVLFTQTRLGLSRRPFEMFKFRTMVANAELRRAEVATMDPRGVMFKVADDPRVTRVGAWLRRTSIDELPQLLNVLRGEMSLVGPRPIQTWVYEQVREPDFHRRFAVLPGMTGRWQVNGRQQHYEEMARHDLAYVESWSVRQDVALLFQTPLAVIRGTGAR